MTENHMSNTNNVLKTAVAMLFAAGLAAGCANKPMEEKPMEEKSSMAAEPGPKESSAAIEAADEAMKIAKPICNLWRDTGKMLDAAKAAFEKGDHAAAVKQANSAKFQADACVKQAEAEKKKF